MNTIGTSISTKRPVWPASRLWQMFIWNKDSTGFDVLADAERVVRYLGDKVSKPYVTAIESGNVLFHLVVSTAPLDEAWGNTYRATLDRVGPTGGADLPIIDVPNHFQPDGNRHEMLRCFFAPLASLYDEAAPKKSPNVFDFRPWMD